MADVHGPETMIQAEGVAIGYGQRDVLGDVTFRVGGGEFWFFVGPNGCGKTTLLRAVLGLLSPRAGRLTLHPEIESRARIGFVPQRAELSRTLPTTVREFVLLGTVRAGVPRGEEAARLEWALGRVGLSGFGARDYWALSGGQRQRALLARALIRRPALLVLDEPTTGLDISTEDALLKFLAALNRDEGLTLLVVSHDIAMAASYGTHVALFHEGRLIAGPRDEVLTPRNLEKVYGVAMEVGREGSDVTYVRVHPGTARP